MSFVRKNNKKRKLQDGSLANLGVFSFIVFYGMLSYSPVVTLAILKEEIFPSGDTVPEIL